MKGQKVFLDLLDTEIHPGGYTAEVGDANACMVSMPATTRCT